MNNNLFTYNYNEVYKRSDSFDDVRRNNYIFHTKNGIMTIEKFVKIMNPSSIIDYGCGYAEGTKNLSTPVYNYDLFVEQYNKPPENPADLIICYNVLHHIEEIIFNNIVAHLAKLCNTFLLCNIMLDGSPRYVKMIDARTPKWYFDRFDDTFCIVDYHEKLLSTPKEFIKTRNFLYLLLRKK